MHIGFQLRARNFHRWLAAISLLIAAGVQAAEPTVRRESFASAASAQSATTAIGSLLDEGRSLESDGRWGDALAHYEEALRDHPDDDVLRKRFDQARLHYSLERRLADGSFRTSVQTLNPSQALDLYSQLLLKINTHYVDTPPWKQLVERGVQAVEIALLDDQFRSSHSLAAAGERLGRIGSEMQQSIAGRAVPTRQDAVASAADVARLVAQRAGLNQSATILEFTAAAAEGLDGYSAYLTANQLRDVYSQIEGNFVGLGVELKADNGALLILDVIPGSPAEQAGILEQDRIVAVDGQETKELSTDAAASLLSGEEGSLVRVTLSRAEQPLRTLTVRRAHVEVPSLENVRIIDPTDGVAYLRIPAFQKSTAADLEAAMWDLHRQGMRSLVLDLRGNPGGLLTASVEVADKFIANGPIVLTRGRSQEENLDYRAHRAGTWRVPLVVLIDGDSASASEIFAAAIKDADRGMVVGERSFGKGSVQGIFPLANSGAGIRLTTAKFFSPEGHPISKLGVQPHIGARRATLVTAKGKSSKKESSAKKQMVAYRGGTDTNSDDQADQVDSMLRTAIDVAREQPVPVL